MIHERKKLDKLDLIKIRNFCSTRDSQGNEEKHQQQQRSKTHRTLGKDTHKSHSSERACIQNSYQELSNLNSEKTKKPIF